MDETEATLPISSFVLRSAGNLLTPVSGEDGGYIVTGLGRKLSIEFTSKNDQKSRSVDVTLLEAFKVYLTVRVDMEAGVIKQIRQKPVFAGPGPGNTGGKIKHGKIGGSQGAVVAPPNDSCSSPIAIGLGPTAFTTIDATLDGTTTCAGFGFQRDTWYTYTAGASGNLTVSTCGGAAFDTLIAMYGSTTCPTGASIACSDDNCGTQSTFTTGVTMGTTYLIRIGQFSTGAGGNGTMTLSLAPVGPANPNDNCAGAVTATCNASTSASNVGATLTGDPAFTCKTTVHNSIWFKFVATSPNAILETTNSVITDTVMALYSGTCGALTQIACNDDQNFPIDFTSLIAVSGLTVGNTYFVQVAGWGSSGQVGTITLDLTCPTVATPGNECSDALPVACGSSTTVDNTFYTTNPTDPGYSCHFNGPGTQGVGTVWFSFVATHTSAKIDTNLSAVSDTLIAMYSGTCGSLVELCCSEDDGVGLRSEVCCSGLVVGNTYLIQVSSFAASSLGDITLTIECPCPAPPANDDCTAAADVGALPASVTFNNSLATSDSPPACGTVLAGPFKNVWYTVTGTGNNLTASTCNAGTIVTDTQISVFCGDCLDLNCVAGNDDFCGFRSQVSWCSQPGVTYFISVGLFSAGTTPGQIQLNVTEAPGACVPAVQCLPTGACCLDGGVCVTTTAEDCELQGGDYSGNGTSCTTDFMVDGSFEGGSPSGVWTEASTNFGTPLCTIPFCGGTGGGTGPRTGQWWSWFGGIPALENGSVEQALVIPVGATSLDFFLEIPVSSGNGVDFLRVRIDGNIEFSVLEGTAPFAGVGYEPVSIPIGAYADGGVHTVRFESTQTGAPGITNFFVDDITMPVQTVSCTTCFVLDFETDDEGNPIGDKQQLAGPEFDGGPNYPVGMSSLSYLQTCGSIGSTAAAYDSDAAPHGQDPDLAVDSGNILILQTDANLSFCAPGVYCSGNDDEDGGVISFVFNSPVTLGSVDLIDVDASGPNEVETVILIDSLNRTRIYTVPVNWTGDLVDDGGGNPGIAGIRTLLLNTLAPQAGFGGTDATATEMAGFDADSVLQIVFEKGADCPGNDGGSGAIDNLTWCQ